jgi:hypothetical protein
MNQAKNEIIFHNYQKFYNMVFILQTTVIRHNNCVLSEKILELSGISSRSITVSAGRKALD